MAMNPLERAQKAEALLREILIQPMCDSARSREDHVCHFCDGAPRGFTFQHRADCLTRRVRKLLTVVDGR
jgi:hypothetical protein